MEQMTLNQKMNQAKRQTSALTLVMLMIMSTTLALLPVTADDGDIDMGIFGPAGDRTPIQSANQGSPQQGSAPVPGALDQSRLNHPALRDPAWTDILAGTGKVGDISALQLRSEAYSFLLEETNLGDHDNDGIGDLDDLDDDNDGIYDLIERFDGCFGTDPLDHDNDGIVDEFDFDDDNDGILEGPIDYSQGADPLNVYTDRYVEPSTIHPWTLTAVGVGYMVDQNPLDRDNDGVNDEDPDGSGRESFDEDDDNDGRLDQFKWPCDFDYDGVQDYFDDDDDNDGVMDYMDRDPYNSSIIQTMEAAAGASSSDELVYDEAVPWTFNNYALYSFSIDYVTLESQYHPNSPAFTSIVDGDLDGDGIPNFLDPDNDADDLPDSADTDDDNDGILDMFDPDDDNDGIKDVCLRIDTNGDGNIDYPGVTGALETPGIDCEIDYDRDLDDDRWRAIDQDYDLTPDWFDTDMGGLASPDNDLGPPAVNINDEPWDWDNDGIQNENDSFMNATVAQVGPNGWNCPTPTNKNPTNPAPECLTERKSYVGNNDWDGDGINNWYDYDDDNDGLPDFLDIDWNCDLDDDNDLHLINGSRFLDDGPNSIDSDIDGDGLSNDEDWDDDNDGINDLYDPDDGNCGVLDIDATDDFSQPYFPVSDGADIDGSLDGQLYNTNMSDFWNMSHTTNPFTLANGFVVPYNGYNPTTNPITNGAVPEFYWYYISRWSPWNGDNHWDIDSDGDSLVNGLDVDQDGDGLPDGWDQDEGNDGVLDIDDFRMGGTVNAEDTCGWTTVAGYTCGYEYAFNYMLPLDQGTNFQYSKAYSIRPDSGYTDGQYDGANSNGNWDCFEVSCWHFEFNGQVTAAVTYDQIANNRDLMIAWLGLGQGLFNWNADINGNFFPDEYADLLNDSVDPDDDCGAPNAGTPNPQCMFNDTADLDDDFDGIYDHWDVDDDNDGIWDFFEIDTNDDLDDDANTLPPGNFFTGTNCFDNDDDGTDTDPDEDGFFQAVWDKGVLGQGLIFPEYYDVDNDNDGIVDTEDPDDDNNGVLDVVQELTCFIGEEQHPFDHDNDGIPDGKGETDWDMDGISNTVELANQTPWISPWDHDNDGIRDDLDLDDDSDGMHDEDEILLWPQRYNNESTNPWDHDDFGGGLGIANPSDPSTGPDVIDNDDDNDSRIDVDWDQIEDNELSSDWDSDNDGILDEDDKIPTRVNMSIPGTMWMDGKKAAIFSGSVSWLDPALGQFVPAPNLPVQVTIEWAGNGTEAVQTIDVLSSQFGGFTVGQFLLPEDLDVGPNTTYNAYAEVTEMFIHDGSTSEMYPLEIRANTTFDYVAPEYLRSGENPLYLDFKTHYSADWDRGIFNNRIKYAPVAFEVSGGPFGDRQNPSTFDGAGQGFRADSGGYVSLTFVQNQGAQGEWKQVRYNASLNNGPGTIPGGYEEIIWNGFLNDHDVVGTYVYTNTTLPKGNYEFNGEVNMSYAGPNEWPFPWLEGDETDAFVIKSVERMFIGSRIIVPSHNPVFFWDSQQFTGAYFGAWRPMFSEAGLVNAGYDTDMNNQISPSEFATVSSGRQYAVLWNDNPADLPLGDASANIDSPLRDFVTTNSTHWFVSMVNGADSNVPPCGPVDPLDQNSPVRCEIVPEMNTGETFGTVGDVKNRTLVPWTDGATVLQVDLDQDSVFAGSRESVNPKYPALSGGLAVMDFNWTWRTEYQALTYGVKVDFVDSNFFFTGNQTYTLSPTGAHVNVSVVGTTDFQLNTVPVLYRGMNTTLEARLIDNSLQPVPFQPVNWTWSANGTSGLAQTDVNGVFKIPLNISKSHDLGNFSMTFGFPGTQRLKSSSVTQALWVVSRTFINLEATTSGERSSGDVWSVSAQVTDDNRTPSIRDLGQALDGIGENGGRVLLIFEGTDFDNRQHRRIITELTPNAGSVYHEMLLNPQLLKDDPESFLPDGFGPVNVILRFEENLPHEGCVALEEWMLSMQGAWDPCTSIPNNEHFRRELQYNVDGFYLRGRTTLDVDDQIVYTSEVNPVTGEVVEKPMTVTGRLTDELGGNLSNRDIQISYQMTGSAADVPQCEAGRTDQEGYFEIDCPLNGVFAGQAQVTVRYNADLNNDGYRFKDATVIKNFAVFSNSTLNIEEVGPFLTDVDRYVFAGNGTSIPVLYLKEPFHVHAALSQSNGNMLGGRCLNIYLSPEINPRPIASAVTDDADGRIEWYSGDPEQNPSRRGVEPIGGQGLEGFRTLRVAYEPKMEVSGGCGQEANAVVNGSHMDITVLVRSRVDIILKDTWSKADGYQPDEWVNGTVQVMRDRLDVPVSGEQIMFIREYWNGTDWVLENIDYQTTLDNGEASFAWQYTAEDVPGSDETAVGGKWRILVQFRDSPLFEQTFLNNTPEIVLGDEPMAEQTSGLFTAQVMLPLLIALLLAAVIGAVMYRNYQERRRIEILRGILTDSLMSLRASNEYIQAIFDCWKQLVSFFRSKGAMKKVYETTREFEDAVNRMLGGITPPHELDAFLSLFEEARYSDHEIGAAQRDRAIQTLQAVVNSLTLALGETQLARAVDEGSRYENLTKAGEFVDADGQLRQAGLGEDGADNFSL